MLTTILLIILALAVLALGLGYLLANYLLPFTLLQPGHKTGDRTPANFGLLYEKLDFTVADGIVLDSFYVPSTETAKANLILLHGVGSCKEVYLPWVTELVSMGYNVMLWDQRAHGKSGGKYLTYGYYEKEDVRLAVDWLSARAPGLPTGIYGNSMGGAVALQSLAQDERLRFGLIESTFTDLAAVTHAYSRRLSGFPVPAWFSNYVLQQAGKIAKFKPFQVQPILAVAQVQQPILHIHGDADAS
ncbi:MAG: alpha/beta fold hydrolase, partial [Bacteroidota bacterium]